MLEQPVSTVLYSKNYGTMTTSSRGQDPEGASERLIDKDYLLANFIFHSLNEAEPGEIKCAMLSGSAASAEYDIQ